MAIGLLFSGQGAQTVGMGRSLYEHSTGARALYEEADDILGWKLSTLSFEGPEDALTQTGVCQPALYVHGYALFRELESARALDDLEACLGLSLGELTALAAAGAFDFATGLRVVAERGRLMQEACEATSGTMASFIGGPLAEVEAVARAHDIDVANLNCPGQVVLSGEKAKVLAAVEEAKAAKSFKMIVPLQVAGAYHSRLMESARERFETFLAGIEIQPPRVAVFSNVTGAVQSEPDEIRRNLVQQVVSPVRWEDNVRSAAALGIQSFYECGPGGVLAGLSRRIDRGLKVQSFAEFEHLASLST
ncbi:MAG: ACP S-malonyltransferase [Opitutales bacterium]